MHVPCSDPELLSDYVSILRRIDDGDYENACQKINEFRREDSPVRSTLRHLLSARISINSGHQEIEEELIKPELLKHPHLKAEAFMIKGFALFQKSDFQRGNSYYEQALPLFFQLEITERWALCAYNIVLGNAALRPESAPAEITLLDLRHLERQLEGKEAPRIKGLILRQKSYILFELGKFHAALAEIQQALPILELHAHHSDYKLALVHAADCAIELEKEEEAKAYLEYITTPIDARLEFPMAYVQAKLSHTKLDEALFQTISLHWKLRYLHWQEKVSEDRSMPPSSWSWDIKEGTLFSQQQVITLKANSREGLLLRALARGPQTKSVLIEQLWPEYAHLETLDNRFHRLISRMNKKIPEMIRFDGSRYNLNIEIHIND